MEDSDLVANEARMDLNDLPNKLAQGGMPLESGDRIKIYDFTCLPMHPQNLLRFMRQMLKKGVSIQFAAPGIVIKPEEGNDLFKLVTGLDNHWRLTHGVRTRPTDSKPGRKPKLTEDQLPAIRRMLDDSGATVSSVAKDLGVGRTTLFDFLQRHRDSEAVTS